jgi:uncharacterized protein YdbL (DUF1318 family)
MRLIFTFLLSVLVFSASATASPVAEAKARMRERVPAVDLLKSNGAIGENNRGYLEIRQPAGDAAEIIAAENADRQVIFADTAASRGGSAEAVGRIFARQIAQASAPGVWLQRENGEWYRK